MAPSTSTLRVFPDAARLRAAPTGSSVDWTFAQLVAALRAGRPGRPVSALTLRALVQQLARSLTDSPFGASVRDPGFAREALALFLDCKHGRLDPDIFEASVENFPDAKKGRAESLVALYSAYVKKVGELGWLDPADRISDALAALASELSLVQTLPGLQRIELTGFVRFSALELELVMRLAAGMEALGLELELSVPGTGATAWDSSTDGLFRVFEQRTELSPLSLFKALPDDARTASAVVRAASEGRTAEVGSAFTVSSFANPREEARHVAQTVRAAVEAGIAPEAIAVVVPDLAEDAAVMREALEQLGLTVGTSFAPPLLNGAWARLLLGLPRLERDRFPVDRVVAWLSMTSGLLAVPLEAPGRVLREAGIRDDRLGALGEKGAYAVRLERLASRLDARRRNDEAREVRAVSSACAALLDVVKALPARAKLLEHLHAWRRAVESLGGFLPVEGIPPRLWTGDASSAELLGVAARELQAGELLRALADTLEASLQHSGLASATVDRRHFERWLLEAASDLTLPGSGLPSVGVAVLGLDEVPGRAFAQVFVTGLSESRVPRPTRANTLFGEEDRGEVNRAQRRDVFRVLGGEGELRDSFRFLEDRFLVGLAVASASELVHCSYPRTGFSGGEQNPSPLLEELTRAAGLTVTDTPFSTLVDGAELWSESALRERVAYELHVPNALRLTAADGVARALGERVRAEAWLREAGDFGRVELERLRFFSDAARAPGPFTGAIHAPELAAGLADAFRFGPERPLSASTLGRFGNCRFQGFATYALRLEEREVPGEEQDARDRGSFWHRVVEELFPRLKQEGLLAKSPREVPDAVLTAALKAAVEYTEATSHLGHPALWRLGRERALAMVRRLLGREHRGLPFEGYEPTGAELVFGRKNAATEWREVVIPAHHEGEVAVYLEGKIDRVDVSARGLGVIDYKSGTQYKKERRDNLLISEFQLPLYLFAARSAGHHGDLHAAWLSLKDGRALSFLDVIEDFPDLDSMLAADVATRSERAESAQPNLPNVVHALLAKLRSGDFAMRAHECGRCGFRAVCRVSGRRLEGGE